MPFLTYFDWLKDRVEFFVQNVSYDRLLEKLYSIEYIPIMARDENRSVDGVAIRDEYYTEMNGFSCYVDTPCSFLEFLYALAIRMNFIYSDVYEDRTQDMFWMMIENMGLYPFEDSYFLANEEAEIEVEEIVNRVIDRTYAEDGSGGLFPLKHPTADQRNVEVWYQMNQYLAELMREEGRL